VISNGLALFGLGFPEDGWGRGGVGVRDIWVKPVHLIDLQQSPWSAFLKLSAIYLFSVSHIPPLLFFSLLVTCHDRASLTRRPRPRGTSSRTLPAVRTAVLQTLTRTGLRYLIRWNGGVFKIALLSGITVSNSLVLG
jgi:hypothetical protein